MTPAEFSDLVGLPVDVVERYQALGLLDPENDGLFDDVDLVRLDFVHHRLAHGEFEPESLAAAIHDGLRNSCLSLTDRNGSPALDASGISPRSVPGRAGRPLFRGRACRP